MIIADLEHYIIPDSYQYILIIFATILFISQSENEVKIILEHVKSAFLYLGFGLVLWFYFYIITKIDAIGVDDLKFFFVAGFLLGQENFLNFMFLSGIIGVIFGGFWTKIKKENIFPFAPALCLAALICLIFDKKFNIIDLAGYIIFQI
jgi:prepilin signal peptidase PulO-like enzyme (type II secretory pathway)